MTVKLKFNDYINIDGQDLIKKYIQSLSYDEREALIDPIFNILRESGFIYPDDKSSLKKSYKKILEYKSPITENFIFNNTSTGTDICKYFCPEFYLTTGKNGSTMVDLFNDDVVLKRLIKNRLGMDWLLDDGKGKGVNEAFNFRFKMVIQGFRSMHLVHPTSMFKPTIAKWVVEKYSNEGDLVGDYSAGFGGRLLGAVAANRRYIGVDPLTANSLNTMIDYFGFNDKAQVIQSTSEDYVGQENSVDLYWSSPPYYNQEYYSKDISQAYNKGEDYFYNIYWRNTLKNVKFMLKPEKWFGLNVKNYPKMVEIAEELFGDVVEKLALNTVRSHLTKSAGVTKEEYIYMFKNNK